MTSSDSGESGITDLANELRNTLFLPNATVLVHSWQPVQPLAGLVEDKSALRSAIMAEVARLDWPEAMRAELADCHLERISSGLLSQYGFAFNLFRIAEDNWFGFDQAVQASTWFAVPAYLKDRRELWLLKDVSSNQLMDGSCVPPDLALVADLGAGFLSFVLTGLAD